MLWLSINEAESVVRMPMPLDVVMEQTLLPRFIKGNVISLLSHVMTWDGTPTTLTDRYMIEMHFEHDQASLS